MKKSKGFSMPETLICTAIVIALGLGAMFTGTEALNFSKYSTAQNDVSVITVAVNQYKFQMDEFPSSLSDLTVKSGSYGPWIDSDALVDPWGNNYIYVVNSTDGIFAVYSKGKNQSGESSISLIAGDDVGKITQTTDY